MCNRDSSYCSSFINVLKTIKTAYTPYTVRILDRNTGVMKVSYSFPLTYWLMFIGLDIMFLVGTYLVFAKEKKQIFN